MIVPSRLSRQLPSEWFGCIQSGVFTAQFTLWNILESIVNEPRFVGEYPNKTNKYKLLSLFLLLNCIYIKFILSIIRNKNSRYFIDKICCSPSTWIEWGAHTNVSVDVSTLNIYMRIHDNRHTIDIEKSDSTNVFSIESIFSVRRKQSK